ncbi:MAG: phenylalanine--tRNA ligase beta subunit-related protein [Halobacteriota archaeon]|nr:phenylalanine--tRNA ligase beta subunit-related protein [Halobacteriota archaeon]
MVLKIDSEVRERFSDLKVLSEVMRGVHVKSEDPDLEAFKEEIISFVKASYTKESLRDVPIFRAYRDFFWGIGIDPTKIRPASEALIRRILQGKPIPRINTLVDAYNLASIKRCIALAAFDEEKISGDITMRFAIEGEEFHGIGMKDVKILNGGEIVISDEEQLIAVYPYRDSDGTKVTKETKNLLILACGVPGIGDDILTGAMDTAIEYINRFCGGEVPKAQQSD